MAAKVKIIQIFHTQPLLVVRSVLLNRFLMREEKLVEKWYKFWLFLSAGLFLEKACEKGHLFYAPVCFYSK